MLSADTGSTDFALTQSYTHLSVFGDQNKQEISLSGPRDEQPHSNEGLQYRLSAQP